MTRTLLVAGATLLALLALVIVWVLPRPSNERRWAIDQSVMPVAQFEGERVVIQGVRNFAWTGAASFRPEWGVRRYQLDELRTAWYVLVPFSKRWRGPAHAFVSFGFATATTSSISVEARRERGRAVRCAEGPARAASS